MIAIADYNKMPDTGSEWDARQLYVRKLEVINNYADWAKIQIELRNGSPDDILMQFNTYFTMLKRLYHNICYVSSGFGKEDRERMDRMIRSIEKKRKSLRGRNHPVSFLSIPHGLEGEMQDLQDEINRKRFELGLVIPVKKPQRFDPTEGWMDSE